MKKMKWIKGMSLLMVSTMLFSCGGSNSSETEATGIKGDIVSLSNSQNLTISIGITTSSGAVGLSYKNYYSPTYVYSEDFINGAWGYIEGSTGIYPVSVNEDDESLLAGEILYNDDGSAKVGLWENRVFSYFSDLNLDEFPTTSGDYALTNKMNVLTMLDIYGFERTRYLEVSSVRVHGGDSLLDFTIDLALGNTIYRLSVVDSSSGESSSVKSFLDEGGSAFVPDEGLVQMRTLFRADNYNRDVLNYETGVSDGTEHFTPDYFFGDYASSATVPYGLMKFDNQDIVYGGATYSGRTGCYYFTVQSNQVVLSPSEPYNRSTNIAAVCFYLHDPLLFSSFEHCSLQDSKYVLTNKAVLNDFAVNNQVYESVTELGASFYKLEISLGNIYDEDAEVEFELYYGLSEAQLYSLKYRFLDFGSANITLIDEFMDSVIVD